MISRRTIFTITQLIVAAQLHLQPIRRIACVAHFPATRTNEMEIPGSVKSLALAPARKTSRTRTACGAAFRHLTPLRGGMGKKTDGREKGSPLSSDVTYAAGER